MKLTELSKIQELATVMEGKNHPVIVVDVQPAYYNGGTRKTIDNIIQFVAEQKGPILMFVNAEQDGLTDDTVQDVKMWWDENTSEWDEENEEEILKMDWDRVEIVDKGYGWFRPYMDSGVDNATMIRLIRYMYQNNINDARDLSDEEFEELLGGEYGSYPHLREEAFSIKWTSVAQLREFNGAYIVGGGRDECLREVELLMNAFNIKYKRIDRLVY